MNKPLLQPVRSAAWALVKTWIKRSFPSVPVLTTRELADLLEQGDNFSPIVIDARRNEEFEVSHLPDAHHARSVEAVQQMGLAQNQPIVVYCSVGYRSARLVNKLQDAGFSAAKNLEGSIFQWANEGRSLVREGEVVKEVHPYNKTWGLLLES